MIDETMVVNLDDLLLFTNSEGEHLRNVKLVLNRLQEHKLYVFPMKCWFFKEGVRFLGLLAGRDGIRVDPEKISVIHK